MKAIAVFGGSGFLRRVIVDQLVSAGMTVRVAVRHPNTTKLSDETVRGGHVVSVCADVADETSVGRVITHLGVKAAHRSHINPHA